MASGLAIMSHDDKEEHARILRHIGEALRADLRGLTDVPPPRPILLQVLHLIRLEQERRGAFAEPISWEDCLRSCDGCCSSSIRSKDRPNCNCGKGGFYVAPRIEFMTLSLSSGARYARGSAAAQSQSRPAMLVRARGDRAADQSFRMYCASPISRCTHV